LNTNNVLVRLFFALVYICFVGAVGYAVWRYQRRRMLRRSDGLIGAANALGFFPVSDDVIESMHMFPEAGPFITYRNVLRGPCGSYETVIFDYTYVVLSGRTSRAHVQTVAAFHLPGANMPDFQLTPRTFEDEVGSLLGGNQLKLESNPEFAEKYTVRGADLESAAPLFTPEVVGFFASCESTLFTVKGYWDWVVIYRPEHQVKPSELGEFVEAVTKIAAGFLPLVPRPLLAH
jgi:hypothetical protein